jgi:ATP sulfurylase
MDIESMQSVLIDNQINGDLWTLPIIFQINEKTSKKISHSEDIYLQKKEDSHPFCLLKNIKVEKLNDQSDLANKWFGTKDLNHPGVNNFFADGEYILSGEPFLLKMSNGVPFNLTPKQTRDVFDHNGWHNIVGFHTRNICHRGHEYIQLKALEEYNADAIFITPVTGKKKKGDFTSKIIMATYNELIRSGAYDPFGVLLNSFNTHSRYSGPREAVFTALCRKNYGCSHFIVGRDHTGVGNYYNSDASQRIFSEFDTGMTIICVDEIVYELKNKTYIINTGNKGTDVKKLSGSIIRDCLKSNKSIPNYLTRPVVANILKIKLRENPKSVFV